MILIRIHCIFQASLTFTITASITARISATITIALLTLSPVYINPVRQEKAMMPILATSLYLQPVFDLVVVNVIIKYQH